MELLLSLGIIRSKLFQTRNELAIVVLGHLRNEQGKKAIRKFSDVAGSYALLAATEQNIVMLLMGGTVVYALERAGMRIGFTAMDPSGAAIVENWLTEVTK